MEKIFFIGIVFLFWGCEDVVDVDIDSGAEKVVVEGWVYANSTDAYVRLSRSVDYLSQDKNPVIDDATVTIVTNESEVDTLNYTEDGYYQTDQVVGVAGNVYHTEIQLADGKRIVSRPDTLYDVAGLVELKYLPKQQIPGGNLLPADYFPAISYRNESGRNYYRYKFIVNGVYLNNPDNIQVENDEGVQPDTTIRDRPVFVSGNNGGLYIFEDGDLFEVVQASLSKQAYAFYAKLDEQVNATGGPFDTPPSPVPGNVYNPEDEDDLIVGFFGATKEDTSSVIIEKE